MLSSLSLALALAAGQSAEAPPRVEEDRVVMMSRDDARRDADGDGFVSREEFMAPLAEAFGRLDKDGDGRLSAEERPSGHGHLRMRHPGGEGEHRVEIVTADDGRWRHAAPMILRHGGPGHGDGERHTITVEANGDGAPKVIVNGREVEGDEANVIVRRMEGGHEAGHHVLMRRPGPGGHAMLRSDDGERHEIFVRRSGGPGAGGLDKDGDGKVSEDEFLAPMREAFREMDADRSGALEDGEHGPHDH